MFTCKTNLILTEDRNGRAIPVKLLKEKKIDENLCEFALSKNFLDKTKKKHEL